MGMPARLARFLYLTAWDLLLPEAVEKPLKVVNRFYQCFICADPAERLALLAEAGPLTDAQIEEVVNHLATEWKPLLRGGTLTDAQRALLRQLARSLHAAGQPGATNDPAMAVRQSLKMEAPKALPPEQREVCRSLVHTALQGPPHRGPSPLPADVPTIPGYTLLRVLGSGAFSTVYLAQESGGTLVALKVMKLADAAQFRREVRTLSQVTGEYLVAYRAHGEIGDRYWIAMHYAGDTTLANLIAGRPSAEVMLPLAEQVLRGLDELHRKGMVHRDLKPENAIVGDDFRLRLIDFGLSKQMEEAGVSTTLGAAGTALYMSPEQIHGQATYASDVWAFGCLLYEMLVGRPLFEGKNIMQVAIEISGRAISVEVPEVPPEVRPFLARCLQRDIKRRFADAKTALQVYLPAADVVCKRLQVAEEKRQAREKRRLEREALRKGGTAWTAGVLGTLKTTVWRMVSFWQWFEGTGLPRKKTLSWKGAHFDFVLIQPGKFQMGQAGGASDETPHPVEITEPFYLLKTPVTQAMYQAVMGTNPSSFTGDRRPVDSVTWNQATEFCDRLSKALKVKIQLPTEAQWEYACRAGSRAKYSFGYDEAQLAEYAWYWKNSGSTTHPVGTRKPNAWGLYDMHGNVWEWCLDAYRSDYENLPAKDPLNAVQTSDRRVLRGGCSVHDLGDCRAAFRGDVIPDSRDCHIGFRLCCSP